MASCPDHSVYKAGCEACKVEAREYMRIYREDVEGRRPSEEHRLENRVPLPINGECPFEGEGRCPYASRKQYVKGCREERCRAENRDYQRDYMKDRRAGISRSS